jgi:hypothetical protein
MSEPGRLDCPWRSGWLCRRRPNRCCFMPAMRDHRLGIKDGRGAVTDRSIVLRGPRPRPRLVPEDDRWQYEFREWTCVPCGIDCPDPARLAVFYSNLLGLPITYGSSDWVVVAESDRSSGYAFQRAPDHQPPRWPDPPYPQQFHLDVMVDDLDEADAWVVQLGAGPLSSCKHVYADPAGHPVCLIRRPDWAPPIHKQPTRVGARPDLKPVH